MRKLLPFIAFTCLTSFSAINAFPVMAGGCSSHRNKVNEIKCDKDDKECQTKNTEKFLLSEENKS